VNAPKHEEPDNPQEALADYLDEMLHAGTSRAAGASFEPARAKEHKSAAQPRLQWDEPRQRVLMPPLARPAPAQPKPAPEEAARPVEKPADEKAAPAVPETEPRVQPRDGERAAPAPTKSSGRPDWAEDAFECLIFKVAGLQLAVPLVLLGAIHRLDRELTEIPGRPDWFMGMLPIGDRNVRVVDTAAWVMAGRYPEGAAANYRLVIRLDESDWGLACDDVAQSFTLDPDDVKWRQTGGKRPWLAGTVVKHMCALVDVGAMAQLLGRAEREQRLDLG